jgi:hypothetical protein
LNLEKCSYTINPTIYPPKYGVHIPLYGKSLFDRKGSFDSDTLLPSCPRHGVDKGFVRHSKEKGRICIFLPGSSFVRYRRVALQQHGKDPYEIKETVELMMNETEVSKPW